MDAIAVRFWGMSLASRAVSGWHARYDCARGDLQVDAKHIYTGLAIEVEHQQAQPIQSSPMADSKHSIVPDAPVESLLPGQYLIQVKTSSLYVAGENTLPIHRKQVLTLPHGTEASRVCTLLLRAWMCSLNVDDNAMLAVDRRAGRRAPLLHQAP